MDNFHISQPATNPDYRNQTGNINSSKLISDDQNDDLMIEDKKPQGALSSGIDLSKMIEFDRREDESSNTIDDNFRVNADNQFVKTEEVFNKEESAVQEVPENNEKIYENINTEKQNEIIENNTNEQDQLNKDNVNEQEIRNENIEDNTKEEKKDNSFLNQEDGDRIYQIEVNKIVPNPYQPRRDFDEDAIQELASSIREYGVLEPLIVKRIEKEQPDGINIEYQLIAGERRLRASKAAGLKTVPAIVKKFETASLELEVALVENVQREDLSPIMKARAYGKLVNDFGYTQEMVGRRVGKSREAVANALRLLQLPFEAQKALDENKINESHARALLLLPNMEKQRALLGEILSKQLSSREAEMIARQFLDKQNIKSGKIGRRRMGDSFSPKDLELREKLEDLFGTKVMIKRKGEKGEISIYFYSEDEFNGLVDRIIDSSEKNINKTVDKLNSI
ncbi:MAG: ParB/RepB/Spo0J family partition protein [Candidatus Pacebacteria bacterium]|nr:ParB/RepB/Spo0J family partition protein [Candidatus Paceibacterota bacterium]